MAVLAVRVLFLLRTDPGPTHIWLDFCSFRTSFPVGQPGSRARCQPCKMWTKWPRESELTPAIYRLETSPLQNWDRQNGFQHPSWVRNYFPIQSCRTCPVDSPTEGSIVFTSEWINPNSFFQYSGFILVQQKNIKYRADSKSDQQ